MKLEEIIAQKSRIVLFESLPLDTFKAREQMIDLGEELTSLFEKPYILEIAESVDKVTIGEDDIVFINTQNSNDILPSIPVLIEARDRYYRLKEKQPKATYFAVCNFTDHNFNKDNILYQVLNQVLNQVFNAQRSGSGNSEFLDSIIGPNYHFRQQTLIEYITDELSRIRHDIGNRKNEAFTKELSQAFMEGNSQTATRKTFLIISDRLKDLVQGKFDIIRQGSDFEKIDFSKYMAVFVDNNYNFKDRDCSKVGDGIHVLERLTELNTFIPIIYQTAHRLENFTDEEILRVTRFPNVFLMPKNRAFKITTVKKAKKEILIGRIIQQDGFLSKYCIKVDSVGEIGYIQNEKDAIITTEAVHSTAERFDEILKTKENLYAHRLMILAAFHTRMKNEVNNPEFRDTITYLRPWKDIEESIRRGKLSIKESKKTGRLYRDLVRKHKNVVATTIIHNDPKWDNWFGGYILGDFGDAGPGTEYKDIARLLLDKDTDFRLVCTDEFVEGNINRYIQTRHKFDSKFNPPEYFLRNVQELIFIESLRLARYKAQYPETKEVVNGLLNVAKHYQSLLLEDSYNRMPSIGDTAPYTSLETSVA